MKTTTLHQQSQLAQALLDSDRAYFELAAETVVEFGTTLAIVPGMTAISAGCVAVQFDKHQAEIDPVEWLRRFETMFRNHAAPLARTYLDFRTRSVEGTFDQAGYKSKLEIGYLAPCHLMAETDVQLRRVVSEADWNDKREVHRQTDVAADGYHHPAGLWTEFIRRKSVAGGMDCYLMEHCGTVVGTIGAMDCGSLLRVKNVFVLPQFRRRGIASGALRCLGEFAARDGKAALGLFAIADSPGDALYRHRGFRAATYQVEWTRELV